LPGAGENLVDHPLVAVDLPARTGVTGARFRTIATARSQLAPLDGPPDLHLFAARPFGTDRGTSPIGRPHPLAPLVSGAELAPGPSVGDADVEGIVPLMAARVQSYHHPVETCRMGPDPDSGAVVGAGGRVHGIDHLYVADASIMPTIPSANTNLPTIMVADRAERISSEMVGERG
jgi:choline dehydrogenase